MIRSEPIGRIRCRWGEGPIWWGELLYWVDAEGGELHCLDPGTGVEQTWELGQRVGTVVPRERGGMVIAGEHGFWLLELPGGAMTPIADPEWDRPGNRFNDGKCSPDGRFFAGTMSFTREAGAARVYCLDLDHAVHEVFGPVTTSNGMAWSADGKTVYYIDTPRREVLAFDYEAGVWSNPRSVVSTGHMDASPDGMAIDVDGNLWVAMCHGGCVSCFNPGNGNELHRITLPCLETTACAFGGPGLADMFVTTGVRASAHEEHAGRLWVIRGLGTRGMPAFPYRG